MSAKKSAASAKTAAAVLSGDPETTAVVPVGQAAKAMVLPAGIKVKRVVTVPSLVLKNVGEPHIVQFMSAMRVSKVVDKKDTKREPAIIADVRDVESGRDFILLVPSVVKANLDRDYPNDEYVNRAFFLQNDGKRTDSQRYYDFTIVEVEPE